MVTKSTAAALAAMLAAASVLCQNVPVTPTRSPQDVVTRYWTMAERGDLLTSEGWHLGLGEFAAPSSIRKPNAFIVISNDWGVFSSTTNGDKAEVMVQYDEIGTVDAQLRFKAAPPSSLCDLGTVIGYDLSYQPTHILMYGSDGKAVVEDKPGPPAWFIQDLPGWAASAANPGQRLSFATLNAAIVYVLRMERKTHDPAIKQNAENTINALLRVP